MWRTITDTTNVLSKTLRTGDASKWSYDGTGKVTAVRDGDDANIYTFLYRMFHVWPCGEFVLTSW